MAYRKYYLTQSEILELINEELAEHQSDNAFHVGAVEALSNLKIKIINNVKPLD